MLFTEGKQRVVLCSGSCDVVWDHSLFDGEPMPATLEVQVMINKKLLEVQKLQKFFVCGLKC